MITINKLKLCPFCGSKKVTIFGVFAYHAECVCGANTAPKATREEAMKIWNTRSKEED